LFVVPTYTPDTTALGARPNFSVAFAPGYNATTANVGLGRPSASRSDSLFGGSDLYPAAQLFWHAGGGRHPRLFPVQHCKSWMVRLRAP
jgi:hypothetical protein